jgi:hypothetical protein
VEIIFFSSVGALILWKQPQRYAPKLNSRWKPSP